MIYLPKYWKQFIYKCNVSRCQGCPAKLRDEDPLDEDTDFTYDYDLSYEGDGKNSAAEHEDIEKDWKQ
jgi:hypothetical protein